MTQRSMTLALLGILLVPMLAFRLGGWAVITVDDLPEYVVAGKPFALSFMVRQHGISPLDLLKPTITMRAGDSTFAVPAVWANTRGHYSAMVTVPRAGEWTATIHSGFMNSQNTLLPLHAIAASAAAPRALAVAERGRHLFFAKGCVSCHVRGAEPGMNRASIGPDLTGKRYEADYVAKFLADPDGSPLSRTVPPVGMRMPKLDLTEREIASLVAYLNSERPVLGSGAPRPE